MCDVDAGFIRPFESRTATITVVAAPAPALRVIVADAHPVTRAGITAILGSDGRVRSVGQTGSVAEAGWLVAELEPDVVTIGIALADGDGIDLCRDIRLRNAAIGIVILSASSDDGELLRALDAGASAFVSKCASPQELTSAVGHSAVAAGSFIAAGLVKALAARHRATSRPLLSERETEVLRLFQQGRSIPEVSAALFVSMSTAKTYVGRLYEKLGATNRAQALMSAVRLGLLSEPTHPAPRVPAFAAATASERFR
jgi:DNA-binding NarL/FixJ family response regulator